MRAQELAKYIEQPHLLTAASVHELQQLVADFPYFQSAHLLLSIAAKKWDTSAYQQHLKRTAIAATNRTHLFNLIHKLEDEQLNVPGADQPAAVLPATTAEIKEVAAEELNILKAAEVKADEEAAPLAHVIESPATQVEKEIARQVVSAFVEKEIIKTPDLHKPPQTPVEQPESFGDWLAFLKKNNGQPYARIEEQVNIEKARQVNLRSEKAEKAKAPENAVNPEQFTRKQKNMAIIDRIIDKNPGLIRSKEEQKFYAPEVKARESLLENEHLMTETLARIYALQGSTGKAIRAYEILSLKYPQKSAYFATLIQQLKNNNKE